MSTPPHTRTRLGFKAATTHVDEKPPAHTRTRLGLKTATTYVDELTPPIHT